MMTSVVQTKQQPEVPQLHPRRERDELVAGSGFS